MVSQSVKYYDDIYHFIDYSKGSQKIDALIKDYHPNAKSLLDVACGTGKHIEYLKKHYQTEGLDINPDLIEIASNRNPGVPFHVADMTSFSLEHLFDVITCLFSSITYVKTLDNLNKAVSRMADHLNPGGLLLIEPFFSPENYWVGRITANFVDKPDLKIVWMYVSEIEGTLSITDINYMVGTPKGVTHFIEREEMGLFTIQEYTEAFTKVGLEVDFDPKGLINRGLYIAKKK